MNKKSSLFSSHRLWVWFPVCGLACVILMLLNRRHLKVTRAVDSETFGSGTHAGVPSGAPIMNMTVAIPITGSSEQIPQLKGLVSSLIMTRSARSTSHLHLVIITDNNETLATWEEWKKDLASSCVGMSSIRVPESKEKGKDPWSRFLEQSGAKFHSGHYGFQGAKWKLVMHNLFDGTEIDEILALDIDQVFVRSLEELWLEFLEMRKTGAGLGITCLDIGGDQRYPYGLDGGRTVCTSSVVLYRRNRLKEVEFTTKLVSIVAQTEAKAPKNSTFDWTHGDQVLFNLFMRNHPKLSHRVDCAWNCDYVNFKNPHQFRGMPNGCNGRTCGLIHYNFHLLRNHISDEKKNMTSQPPPFLLDFANGYRRLPLRFLGTRNVCDPPSPTSQ